MALRLGSSFFGSLSKPSSGSSSRLQVQRNYAKDAKAKGKGKAGATKAAPKVIKVSRAEARKRSVILTQTVPGTGEKGEELKVTRGFARNFLFARNLAKLTTEELRAKYAPFAAAIDYEARTRAAALKTQTKRIASVKVLIKRHMVEETKKPIHPVSKQNIIEKLEKQHKIILSADQIELAAPIERYGNYTLPISFSGVSTQLQVNIGQR